MPRDNPSSTISEPPANSLPQGPRPSKFRIRRLHVDDVNVVNKPMLKKAVGGTIVGNTMEWFDVGVYGYLAVTMGQVFFPSDNPTVSLLSSLAVFAVTFLFRPLGGVIFGYFGDKIGRQKVLATTLIMMAASTFLIGVLPTFAQIGLWAPALLVVLKVLQGFSTGGEYAGATTFVSEYAPDKHRGFLASILDLGSYLGFALGAIVVSVMQLNLSEETMLEWGWRIPFLVAGPLGAIAIYFRLKIEESPTFQATMDAQEAGADAGEKDDTVAHGPIGIFKAYWRQIVIAGLLVAAANTVGYALTSYMPSYLTGTLGYDPLQGTLLTIPVLILMSLCIPLTGRLSDRIGRRPVLWIGAGSAIVLAVPAFLLIGMGPLWATVLGLMMVAFPVTFYVANLASALPALFPTASRYGGMGISYNFAVAIFGGTAPFIMAGLIALTGDPLAPAYWLMFTSAVGAVTIYFMKESAGRPLPGSMPSVETAAEASELVASQEENPLIDHEELPLESVLATDPTASSVHTDELPADTEAVLASR